MNRGIVLEAVGRLLHSSHLLEIIDILFERLARTDSEHVRVGYGASWTQDGWRSGLYQKCEAARLIRAVESKEQSAMSKSQSAASLP